MKKKFLLKKISQPPVKNNGALGKKHQLLIHMELKVKAYIKGYNIKHDFIQLLHPGGLKCSLIITKLVRTSLSYVIHPLQYTMLCMMLSMQASVHMESHLWNLTCIFSIGWEAPLLAEKIAYVDGSWTSWMTIGMYIQFNFYFHKFVLHSWSVLSQSETMGNKIQSNLKNFKQKTN